MRVWLITIGEPLPTDGPNVRLMRTGILAETLAELGMDVVWWTAAFSHEAKRHRFAEHTTIRLNSRLTLKLLHSSGYATNVSLARVRDHAQVARAFSELAPQETRPDVIASSLPTPSLCIAAADYAQPHGVPLLVDLRDRWPDVFLDLLPPALRWAGRLGLARFFRQTAEGCQRAAGLVGVTESFLKWGLDCARRERGCCDAVLPIGYKQRRYADAVVNEAREFWNQAGIPKDENVLTVCFFGTLGRQFALNTVIEAARTLGRDGQRVRFVLCGSGDFLSRFRREARDLPNVFFPGRIDGPKIHVLMERSQVGLAPYRTTPNFSGHIPNKPAEYLSSGLPVISTITGELAELLESYECGRTYDSGSAAQLAGILRHLADSPQGRRAMSANARRLFAERFDADKVYAAYARHLGQVVEAKSLHRRAA
jgi:glycosyltransferase involved in cell wall biosynthesis